MIDGRGILDPFSLESYLNDDLTHGMDYHCFLESRLIWGGGRRPAKEVYSPSLALSAEDNLPSFLTKLVLGMILISLSR